MSFFLVAPPGLIDTFARLLAWRSLLWLSMIWWWIYLTQSGFLSTTSLAWSLALHLLFVSTRRSLYGGRKSTHTHPHTHMTLSNSQAWSNKSILLNNMGSKHSLLMKFCQLMSYYKRKDFITKILQKLRSEKFQVLLCLRRI